MKCLKLLCAVFVLFMFSMESESAAIVDSSDDESIGPVSVAGSKTSDEERADSVDSFSGSALSDDESICSASLTVRSVLSDLDMAWPVSAVKPKIIPRLMIRHVSKNGLNNWILYNVRSHEDLVAKFGLKEERILMVVYGDLGKYEGPETFSAYASIVSDNPDPKAFLIYIYERLD